MAIKRKISSEEFERRKRAITENPSIHYLVSLVSVADNISLLKKNQDSICYALEMNCISGFEWEDSELEVEDEKYNKFLREQAYYTEE